MIKMTDVNDFLSSCLDNNLFYDMSEIKSSETANTTNTTNTKKIIKTDKQSNAISYIPTGKNNIYITKSGAFLKFEYLSIDPANLSIVNKILKHFTMRKKQIIGYDKVVKCYKLDKKNKRIILPRFGIFEILNDDFNLKDYTTISQIVSGQPINIKWEAKLTDNQKIISEYIINNIYIKERIIKGSAGLILNLEAGQGKSYLAAYLISVLKKKTVIIMHSTSLLLQWEKVIKNCFNNIKIGYYYNQCKIDGDVVLMIINSAQSDIFKFGDKQIPALEYYNSFGFAIYDECHLYANNFCNKVFKLAQTECILGLSATPDENVNGFDKMVWWELGPVLDARTLRGYSATSENFTADVHKICYKGPPAYTRNIVNEATDMCLFANMVNMVCSDIVRSFIVVDCIKQGLDLGLYMYVFADRRQYLLELKDILKFVTGINSEIIDNDEDYIRIVGGASDEAMEQAELKSRVVFTTYQYMGTGKSIIKMNGLVLATPRKSKMKQYINRIFRLGSDASIKRHIWDICDSKTKFNNLWRHRDAYYKTKNYNIIKTNIEYTDYNSDIIQDYKAKLETEKAKTEKVKTEKAKLEAEKAKLEAEKVKTEKVKAEKAKLESKKEIKLKNKNNNLDSDDITNFIFNLGKK
jgi:hypothetical protein